MKMESALEHPGKKLEVVRKKNYFFQAFKYQKTINYTIESDKYKIDPIETKNDRVFVIFERTASGILVN